MPLITETPKFILALDLDFTAFDRNQPKVTFLGGEAYWTKLFDDVERLATFYKVEMVFTIITNKRNFDDVSEIAARTFISYLKKHNPAMSIHKDGKQYCLVNCNQSLQYESMKGPGEIPVSPDSKLLSHFVVVPLQDKAIEIKKIAAHYGISSNHGVLLDDTPQVLVGAIRAGIQTVSFHCFHQDQEIVPDLENKEYVDYHLRKNKAALMECIKKISDAIALFSFEEQFRALTISSSSSKQVLI